MKKIFSILLILLGCSYAEVNKPNVVIILADDTGYGDLSCYGNTRLKTPKMDSIAKDGILFTDGHSPSSVCSPSRYNLMTGRHSWRTFGGMSCFWMASNPMPIETDRLTLPKLFKKHGYKTACVGKWHLSFGNEEQPVSDYTAPFKPGPMETGFDYFFGVPHIGQTPHLYIRNHYALDAKTEEPLKDIFQKSGETPPLTGYRYLKEPDSKWLDRKVDKQYEKYFYDEENLAVRLTKEAVDYIEKAKADKPFFLYFDHRNTHGPIKPNRRFQLTENAYDNFLLEMDWSVGEILNAIKRKRLDENTIVIFSSDNGASVGSNKPLRGNKTLSFEGGHRVPFMVKWPGKIKAGSISDKLVALTDLMATFAELFNSSLAETEAEDSFSFIPCLLGTEAKTPLRKVMVNDGWNARTWAVRHGKWKLILPNEDPAIARQNFFKLGRLMSKENTVTSPMLFNLDEDLGEQRDLAAENPEKVKMLRELLENIKSSSSRKAQNAM